jgi:anti-sigma-K factor RskA
LTQLSRDIQTSLVPRPAPPAPFPLDGVMRIHEELRGGANAPALAAPADTASTVAPDPQRLLDRVDSLERELTTEKEEVRRSTTTTDRLVRNWRAALTFAVAVILVTGYFGFRLTRYVEARMNDANARVVAAERQAQIIAANASREVAVTRTEAERQIAEARGAALQAQLASAVSVAPDLVRFNLTPADTTAPATAQVLWSRTAGLVVTSSRLPAAPDGTTYQIWLLNNTAPIAAGVFLPDRNGRVTIAFENPADLPRPINGAMVTLEPAGGSPSPSGTPVLLRPPQ